MFNYRLEAFFDESVDRQHLCIAGLFGPPHHWAPFKDAWKGLLLEYEMPEFHASECMNRRGFWKGWANPAERRAVYRRFLSLITKSVLPSPSGFAVGVDLTAYERFARATIRASRSPAYSDPWLFAFQHVLDRMVDAQELANQTTGQTQRIALVFDEKDEFRGRVENMIRSTRSDGDDALGSVTFADSRDEVVLQAADLLAYEVRRCLSEVILRVPPLEVRDEMMESSVPGRSAVDVGSTQSIGTPRRNRSARYWLGISAIADIGGSPSPG